jgi:para-nitrobenzyl esterase
MKLVKIVLVLMLGLMAAPAFAQPSTPPGAPPAGGRAPATGPILHNALVDLTAKDGATLTVTTPAFVLGGDIPFENSSFRGSKFPGLTWTAGPAGTKTYAIIMQDMGAVGSSPRRITLHWTAYDIPPTVTTLAPGMTPTGMPAGSSYGPSAQGNSEPYMGPGPPPGPRHAYHLQVFALDTSIAIDPMMTFETLTGAMKGHVLASGEIVGLASVDMDNWPRKIEPPAPSVPASAFH